MAENEGYLVVAFEISNSSFEYISIHRRGALVFSHKIAAGDIVPGINYRVIRLKAGTYYWRSLKVFHRRSFTMDKDVFGMRVEAGKINYGGHLFVDNHWSRASIRMVNRATETIDHLADCCQNLLDEHQLVYARGGGDPFLDYLSTLGDGPL